MIRSVDATLKRCGIKEMPIIEVLASAKFDGAMRALDRVEGDSWLKNEYDTCIHLSADDFKLIRQDFIRAMLEETR